MKAPQGFVEWYDKTIRSAHLNRTASDWACDAWRAGAAWRAERDAAIAAEHVCGYCATHLGNICGGALAKTIRADAKENKE